MTHRISQADLIDTLPDILDRVHDDGERFVVERDGSVIAVIQAASHSLAPTLHQLPALLTGVSWPDPEFFDELATIRTQMNIPVEPPAWPS